MRPASADLSTCSAVTGLDSAVIAAPREQAERPPFSAATPRRVEASVGDRAEADLAVVGPAAAEVLGETGPEGAAKPATASETAAVVAETECAVRFIGTKVTPWWTPGPTRSRVKPCKSRPSRRPA